MALTFSVFNKFSAVDKVTKPMRKMEKSVGRFGRTTTKEFKRADRGASKFATKLKSIVAIGAAVVSIQAVTAGLSDAIATGAEFEQTIVNAAAKFGDQALIGSENFKLLEESARKAGKTTEFTAAQSAEGLNFLALAGFNVEQSMAALPGVIDLATAAQIELGAASDIATDTLGAFNLTVKDSAQLQKNLTRVTDVMAKATTTANVDMEQLFETFTEAGPIATSLGASIETVAALAGKLGDAGIKGSKAGTTLKNVFVKLAAATPEASKRLDQLGVKLKNNKGNFRDVFDILEDLNKGLVGLGDVERAAILNDIFGKIPIAGVNVLLKTGAQGLRDYRTELEKATGASAFMAHIMRSTLGTKFKFFKSAVEGLKITVFETLKPLISDITDNFIKLVQISEKWVSLNKGAIREGLSTTIDVFKALGKTVSFFTDLLTANKDMIPMIGTLLGLFAAWKVAFIALNVVVAINNALMAANPIGLFIIALAAAALGIKAVYDNWDFLVSEFKGGINFIQGLFRGFESWISEWVNNLGSKFGDIVNNIMNPISDLINNFGSIIEEKVNGFVSGFADKINETMSGIGQSINDFFSFGDDEEIQNQSRPRNQIPISPTSGLINTIREEKESRSVLDVNINDPKERTEIKRTGAGTGFTLNTGFSGAG